MAAAKLTRAHVERAMSSYNSGDFKAFVVEQCTPDFTYELVPGNLKSKLGVDGRQHEFSGTFHGHEPAVKMILEGLTGREVKDLKISARILRIVVDSETNSAAVEAELFGDARRTSKPFILANALFFEFDEQLKIKYWSDHLDTFTLAKLAGVNELDPELP